MLNSFLLRLGAVFLVLGLVSCANNAAPSTTSSLPSKVSTDAN